MITKIQNFLNSFFTRDNSSTFFFLSRQKDCSCSVVYTTLYADTENATDLQLNTNFICYLIYQRHKISHSFCVWFSYLWIFLFKTKNDKTIIVNVYERLVCHKLKF
jgi:hypothetical protein